MHENPTQHFVVWIDGFLEHGQRATNGHQNQAIKIGIKNSHNTYTIHIHEIHIYIYINNIFWTIGTVKRWMANHTHPAHWGHSIHFSMGIVNTPTSSPSDGPTIRVGKPVLEKHETWNFHMCFQTPFGRYSTCLHTVWLQYVMWEAMSTSTLLKLTSCKYTHDREANQTGSTSNYPSWDATYVSFSKDTNSSSGYESHLPLPKGSHFTEIESSVTSDHGTESLT